MDFRFSLLSQHSDTLLRACLSLLLVAFVKSNGALMVTPDIVQGFDLVNTDDPVLTGESFIQNAQLRTLSW